MNELEIPLFPLKTVLFPEGLLPLRIFEPRYLDMVSACMKNDTGFGVCLIREGSEVGAPPTIFRTGTLAKITDWHMSSDGLLGIMAHGEQRFHVLSEWVEPNHLLVATVELVSPEPSAEIPPTYLPLVDLLRQILEQSGPLYADVPKKYTCASWVSARLAELLPLKATLKQDFLQVNDPVQRLARIHAILEQFDIR